MVRRKRFELLTYRFVACCSIQLGYRRTWGSIKLHEKLVRRKRFELLTYRFVACCSIQLGYRRTQGRKAYTFGLSARQAIFAVFGHKICRLFIFRVKRVFRHSGQATVTTALIPRAPLGYGPTPGGAVAAPAGEFFFFPYGLRANVTVSIGVFHTISLFKDI